MTQKEIKKMQKRVDYIWDALKTNFGDSLQMELIEELVESELLLEAECNQ